MARTLVFDVDYPHPPDRVWAAITSSAAIGEWLMANDFAPELGRRFQLRAKPMPGWSGIVDCEVVELEPPGRMVWRWKSDHIDTTVSFTLVPTPTGTRLHLVHDGFRGPRGHFVSWMMRGWKGILRKRLHGVLERFETIVEGTALTPARSCR
ncbi:MAG TPA: SRPBCC domain-containing protein [Planctomycetota bacterium]|nr:SRPBCC domain-containing protein [Planctomycetota bacterium]